MSEWFEMGKYTFYVWTAVGFFVAALVVDLVSARKQHQTQIKQLKAKQRRES